MTPWPDRRRQFGQESASIWVRGWYLPGAGARPAVPLLVGGFLVVAGQQGVEAPSESLHLNHAATLSRISWPGRCRPGRLRTLSKAMTGLP